jgi:hypothetical protein
MLAAVRSGDAKEQEQAEQAALQYLVHRGIPQSDLATWFHTGHQPSPDIPIEDAVVYVVYKTLLNGLRLPDEDLGPEIGRGDFVTFNFSFRHLPELAVATARLKANVFTNLEERIRSLGRIRAAVDSGGVLLMGHLREVYRELAQREATLGSFLVDELIIGPHLEAVVSQKVADNEPFPTVSLSLAMEVLRGDCETLAYVGLGPLSAILAVFPGRWRI